jgi:hypothetical protein
MKAKPMGMVWMTPTGWRNSLPGVLWRALETLPEGRLMDRMNRVRFENFRILRLGR